MAVRSFRPSGLKTCERTATAMPGGLAERRAFRMVVTAANGQTGEADGAFCAIGIHRQWIYVDPVREITIAKLSSQPNPVDDAFKLANLAFFRTLCTALE